MRARTKVALVEDPHLRMECITLHYGRISGYIPNGAFSPFSTYASFFTWSVPTDAPVISTIIKSESAAAAAVDVRRRRGQAGSLTRPPLSGSDSVRCFFASTDA